MTRRNAFIALVAAVVLLVGSMAAAFAVAASNDAWPWSPHPGYDTWPRHRDPDLRGPGWDRGYGPRDGDGWMMGPGPTAAPGGDGT